MNAPAYIAINPTALDEVFSELRAIREEVARLRDGHSEARIPVTATEYARRSGLNARTVTNLLRDGKLPGHKAGGSWMVRWWEIAPF